MASPTHRIVKRRRRRRPMPTSTSAASTESSGDSIYLKNPGCFSTRDGKSVSVPMSFAPGSIIGKRFYREVTTRESEDGAAWHVMLDRRTLMTPSKRPLRLPTLSLAKSIAGEWECQQADGIRPYTMPLMKLACAALEKVPLMRVKIIEHLMKKFHQDLVFCRSPGDSELTKGVRKKQEEKIKPLLDWVHSKFGFKPQIHYSFLGGKQEDGLVKAVEDYLEQTDDCVLAAIDAIAAAAHSVVIPIGIFCGRLGVQEATEIIRLEEDLQVDRCRLVEGGRDVDIVDFEVQILSGLLFVAIYYPR